MAVTRTILPRKGLIQSQHGLTGYEADQDANWQLLDSNLAFVTDLLWGDIGVNGVAGGFALSTSSSLTPGIAAGVLYAQGSRYAPSAAPAIPAAPASGASYLFYNSSSGFYWQASAVAANAGDALIGQAVTSASAITAVTQATIIFGHVPLAPSAAGNFTVQHLLGRKPAGASLLLTSTTLIVWQAALWDSTNLYLNAAGAASGFVIVW